MATFFSADDRNSVTVTGKRAARGTTTLVPFCRKIEGKVQPIIEDGLVQLAAMGRNGQHFIMPVEAYEKLTKLIASNNMTYVRAKIEGTLFQTRDVTLDGTPISWVEVEKVEDVVTVQAQGTSAPASSAAAPEF